MKILSRGIFCTVVHFSQVCFRRWNENTFLNPEARSREICPFLQEDKTSSSAICASLKQTLNYQFHLFYLFTNLDCQGNLKVPLLPLTVGGGVVKSLWSLLIPAGSHLFKFAAFVRKLPPVKETTAPFLENSRSPLLSTDNYKYGQTNIRCLAALMSFCPQSYTESRSISDSLKTEQQLCKQDCARRSPVCKIFAKMETMETGDYNWAKLSSHWTRLRIQGFGRQLPSEPHPLRRPVPADSLVAFQLLLEGNFVLRRESLRSVGGGPHQAPRVPLRLSVASMLPLNATGTEIA